VTTHWSVVQAAGHSFDTKAREALAALCRGYWYPLYVYVRRRGYRQHDAEDLTQAFFARLLERNWIGRAEQAKGRFRTFLLTALERFLANEWDKVRARKRGGGREFVPVQIDEAETRYGVEPVDERTPEQAFEYHWAVTLLDEVVRRLEREFQERGQPELFAALKPCLTGGSSAQPYDALAAKLGLSEAAVKVAVHRLRQRYRELLRAEIADTVASPQEVDAEMRHLLNVLAGPVRG
jgi:RNA polymerase sigma-70 factor (ECF subfamily)